VNTLTQNDTQKKEEFQKLGAEKAPEETFRF
jgi:hypothetical protein